MKKLILTILFCLIPVMLFSTPSLVLNGPFGGKAELACSALHQLSGNDYGGGCSVYYVDYSTISGWKFNGGPLEIGYSLLNSENIIWVDFLETKFPIDLIDENNGKTYKIEVTNSFSFVCTLPDLKCTKVVVYGTSNQNATIKVNGKEISVTPNFLHFFLHIFQ